MKFFHYGTYSSMHVSVDKNDRSIRRTIIDFVNIVKSWKWRRYGYRLRRRGWRILLEVILLRMIIAVVGGIYRVGVGVGVGGRSRSRKKRLLGPSYEERCRSAVLASQQRKAALGGGDDVKKVALFVPRNSVLEYDRCVARRYETS